MSTDTVICAPVPSLRVNFSWTMLGNTVYIGTQWGILVLLARLSGPEAVGQFSLGLAIAAPIMLFAGLQLRMVQATDAHVQFQFRDYAGLRILLTTVAALLILSIGGVLYRGETALAVGAFALSKGIESISDIVYGLWQQRERMDLIAKSLMLRGVLALAAAAFCLTLFHTVWAAVCGMTAAWAAVLAAFDVPHGMSVAGETRQSFMPRFSLARMKKLALLSLPLGIVTMLISLNGSIPRYMISHFRTVRELGIFSALGYMLTAGSMIVGALGQSATPRLALYASRDWPRFRGLSYRLLSIGMALGMLGILTVLVCGRQAVTLIYGREYAESYALLVWLMVAAAASYLAALAGYSLTAARHFHVQMPLFAVVTALTLGLCYAMVRTGGSLGAAKALAIVGFVQLTATMAILRQKEAQACARMS